MWPPRFPYDGEISDAGEGYHVLNIAFGLRKQTTQCRQQNSSSTSNSSSKACGRAQSKGRDGRPCADEAAAVDIK
eukprot:scaffold74423_cov27-Tisochrysis_lutea.AAC.10